MEAQADSDSESDSESDSNLKLRARAAIGGPHCQCLRLRPSPASEPEQERDRDLSRSLRVPLAVSLGFRVVHWQVDVTSLQVMRNIVMMRSACALAVKVLVCASVTHATASHGHKCQCHVTGTHSGCQWHCRLRLAPPLCSQLLTGKPSS